MGFIAKGLSTLNRRKSRNPISIASEASEMYHYVAPNALQAEDTEKISSIAGIPDISHTHHIIVLQT